MLQLFDLLGLLLFDSSQLLFKHVNGGVVCSNFLSDLGYVFEVVMMFGMMVLVSLLGQSLVLGGVLLEGDVMGNILGHVDSHVFGSILGGCDVLLHD